MTDQDQPFVPTVVPFNPSTAEYVAQLVKLADLLEVDYDSEPYSDDPADGHPWPKAKAAWAVKARPFAKLKSAGFAILRSVCGSDGHPLCRQWLTDVHSPVVYAVRQAAGILEGFVEAWRVGALWTASDEAKQDTIQQQPSDFGKTGIQS